MKRYVFILMCVFPLCAQAASNVVYKCKDARGKIVFQQVACDEGNVVGNSPAHSLWREMRELSSEGRNILGSLGADIDSIKQCNRAIAVFNKKVEDLTPAVTQVGKQHHNLVKAQVYLKDCGVCKTSAEANCRTADKYLDKAVAKLTEY